MPREVLAIALHSPCIHTTERLGALPSTFPLPHPSSRTPVFPSHFSIAFPSSASPQRQGSTTSLLSFPTRFNLAETWDCLFLLCVPSPKEGVDSIWTHTKRGLGGCSTTQELGGPSVFPPHADIPRSYTGAWA